MLSLKNDHKTVELMIIMCLGNQLQSELDAKLPFGLDRLGLVTCHIEPWAFGAFRMALSPEVWATR